MVQGYKRRWSRGHSSSIPTPVDGSIELLILQYCPILSCLVFPRLVVARFPCLASQ